VGDVLKHSESISKDMTKVQAIRLDRLTYEELATELRVQPCTVRAWTMQGCPTIPCGR
jgi:hypothetical protein